MADQEPSEAADTGWMTRLGEGCLRALGVALLASVPAALRTSGAGGGFFGGLHVSMGVLLPLTLAALLLSRAAGRGFRQLLGTRGPRPVVVGLALWIGLAVPMLAVLGAVLKATTHHRGLGGATFGAFALAAAVTSGVIALRLVRLGQALMARGIKPWVVAAAGAAVGLLPLLVVALPLGQRGDDPGTAAVRAAIVDGAIVVVATALAASMELGASLGRVAHLGAVPAAVVVLVAGAARVESDGALAAAMKRGGGLAPTVLLALERWTDRDNDGAGAHFGGDDCDEGDPARHPGAAEVPGDGVDQDCDGADPAAPPPAKSATAAITSPNASASASAAAGPTKPASVVAPAASGKPDIIVITLDSVRADHSSAYGYARNTTPKLAELGARGVVFEHAYAAGGDPQRALAPIATGKRLGDTARDKREWPTILAENDTVAERLKRAGYRTAAVTSFTWLSAERGFAQGFDHWKPIFEGLHPEREVTGNFAIKAAINLWKELEKDPHPVYLWVHLFDAHERYLDHKGITFGKGKAAAYDAEIAFVDQKIGELMAAVAASGRASRVAWIVHGSQGEAFGEHDNHGHGGDVYEEALRVPLVVALPDGKPGRYDKDAVSVVDVPATVADLAGAPGDGFAGASLAPMVRGDLGREHGPVYARSQKKVALIVWPLKLIVFEKKKADRFLLFDLGADPGEKEDVSKTTSRGADLERMQKARAAIEGAGR